MGGCGFLWAFWESLDTYLLNPSTCRVLYAEPRVRGIAELMGKAPPLIITIITIKTHHNISCWEKAVSNTCQSCRLWNHVLRRAASSREGVLGSGVDPVLSWW